MIDELVKSVRLHLSERLTSPLMGAFVVTWSLWNFRTLMVVFSGEKVQTKFALINDLHQNTWPSWTNGLIGPIATTLLYFYVYPIISKEIFRRSRLDERARLGIRRDVENETLLSVEDSRKLKEDYDSAYESHWTALTKKEVEIDRLNKALNGAIEAAKQFQEAAEAAEKRADEARSAMSQALAPAPTNPYNLSERQQSIIRFLARFRGRAKKEHMGELGLSDIALDFYLSDLVVQNFLVQGEYDAVGTYALNQKGRAAYMAMENIG